MANDFAAAMGAADAVLFEQLGESGEIVRGAGAAVTVTVFVQKSVERLGDYGQVVSRVTTVDFRSSEWRPQPGDVLTVDSLGAPRRIASIEADDGMVVRTVLHG